MDRESMVGVVQRGPQVTGMDVADVKTGGIMSQNQIQTTTSPGYTSAFTPVTMLQAQPLTVPSSSLANQPVRPSSLANQQVRPLQVPRARPLQGAAAVRLAGPRPTATTKRCRSSSEVIRRYSKNPVIPPPKRSYSFSLPSPSQEDRTPSPTEPTESSSSRRRQYVCRFENCRNPRPNKKSNIEKHVWTQHIRHRFKGLDQVSYQAKLYKCHVEQYVVPVSSTSSTASTPLVSPSAKQQGAPIKMLPNTNAKNVRTRRRGRPSTIPRVNTGTDANTEVMSSSMSAKTTEVGLKAIRPASDGNDKENRIAQIDAAKLLLKLSLCNTSAPYNCLSMNNVNMMAERRSVEIN